MNETNTAISTRLAAMKLPVPEERILVALLDMEGAGMIQNALAAAGEGKKKAVDYLEGLFYTLAPGTKDRLAKRGFPSVPLRVAIAIGKSEGSSFAKRLKAWDEAGGQENDEARYIRLTIAKQMASMRANQESQEASRGQPPTEASHGQQPAARQRGTQEAAPANNVSPMRRAGDADGNRSRDSGYPTQGAQDEDGEPAERPDDGREYLSTHIYGGKAAACFSADQTRGKTHTIRIEAAESKGTREYDWKKKITIQLSSRELPLILAVFMNWLPKFEGKGHGTNNEKWFTLENQGGKLYLSVNSKGVSPRGVPIMPGDAYSVTTLFMRQMLKNDPFLSSESLLVITKKQVELMRPPVTGNMSGAAAA